jgi:hypothetical protein
MRRDPHAQWALSPSTMQAATVTFKRVLDFLNPVYHIRRLMEDLTLMKQAFKSRKSLGAAGAHDKESLQQLFRGKLFSAFFMSGPSGLLAAALAYTIQRLFDSHWIGLLATFVFALVITSIAYQIVWYIDNRILYDRDSKGKLHGILELQKDMWPIHLVGLKTGAFFFFVVGPINAAILGAFELMNRDFAKWFPVPVVVFLVDIAIVQGPFLRIMGDFFEKHSFRLAEKYAPAFCDR